MMWIIWLILGIIVGWFIGFVCAAIAAVETDKKAVADGVIKLCGRFFALKEIEW